MTSQKKFHSLKAINLLLVIAMVLAGVAVNVSPVRAAVSAVVITSPTGMAPATVKSGDDLEVKFTVEAVEGDVVDFEILLGSELFTGSFTADLDSETVDTVTETIVVPVLPDGDYDLQVKAKARTQAVWAASVAELGAVIVDNTPPATPELTAPDGGESWLIGDSKDITWMAEGGLDAYVPGEEVTISLYYSANGGGTWSLIEDDIDNADYSWQVPSVVTTQALVKIIVTDQAGNQAWNQSDAVFTIYGADITPPTVAVGEPSTGDFVGGVTLLEASASDGESGIASVVFQYSQDGGALWFEAGSGSFDGTNYVLEFDTTAHAADGEILFRAVAVNGAGASTASPPVAAIVDNSIPGMDLLAPAADGAWVGNDYSFGVTASDAESGIAKLEIYQFVDEAWEELCFDAAPGDPVEGVYTLTCVEDGSLAEAATQIKAVVTNGAGLAAQVIRAIRVDGTNPIIPTGMLLAPVDSAVLQIGSAVAIQWKTTGISDANLGETPISLELRHSTLTTVLAEGLPVTPGSFAWTVAGVPGSTYEVCVVVSDLAGNTAEDCGTGITIWGTDVTAPLVSLNPIESPNAGEIELSAEALDAESGIQKVEFFVKLDATGAVYNSVGSSNDVAPYSVSWDTTSLDGEYMIKAVATNGVGTTAEDEIGPVLIDNTVPTVDEIVPAGGGDESASTFLAGSVTFSAKVNDLLGMDEGSGVASVTFEYGLYDEVEAEWVFEPIGAGAYNAGTHYYDAPAWDTTAFEDGTVVQIRVIALDNAGNQTIEGAGFYEINNGELEFEIHLLPGWNLISLPLVPGDPAIDAFLAELVANESVLQVVAWPYQTDAIHEMRWDGVALLDIAELNDGVGYWVEMSKPDVLTFSGSVLPAPPMAPPSYVVYAGWNLIGFKSMGEMTAESYLGEAGEGNMRAMYGYDAANRHYTQITLDDPNLQPGEGYWLAVSENATIYPSLPIND